MHQTEPDICNIWLIQCSYGYYRTLPANAVPVSVLSNASFSLHCIVVIFWMGISEFSIDMDTTLLYVEQF